jgi:hypothetical protein
LPATPRTAPESRLDASNATAEKRSTGRFEADRYVQCRTHSFGNLTLSMSRTKSAALAGSMGPIMRNATRRRAQREPHPGHPVGARHAGGAAGAGDGGIGEQPSIFQL